MKVILIWILCVSHLVATQNVDPTSLGVQFGGSVPDAAFRASSATNRLSRASKGRLNTRGSSAAWMPKRQRDADSWIEVDLGHLFEVQQVKTQGRADGRRPYYTTQYRIAYSIDQGNFNESEVYTGNQDKNSVVTNTLEPPVKARYFRIYPMACSKAGCALRFNLIGKPACFEDGYERLQDFCYSFIAEERNHTVQQEHCEIEGGQLTSISSEEENTFVSIVSGSQRSWIGGRRDPESIVTHHFWLDGTSWSFQNWRQGKFEQEPNFWNDKEFCVETNFVRAGLWNDHFCNRDKPAICKKPFSFIGITDGELASY